MKLHSSSNTLLSKTLKKSTSLVWKQKQKQKNYKSAICKVNGAR
jgi:hypothetical protein